VFIDRLRTEGALQVLCFGSAFDNAGVGG
jgi:hypothetical protein